MKRVQLNPPLKKFVQNIFIICIACVMTGVWGQEEEPDFLPQITPPSPDAAALGNYGNIPVGEFTGAANINLPLLTYKTKNLEVPISLFYGSNGIRVDEFGSKVGLGWNLNVGGVITRTVRDLGDYHSNKKTPPDDITGGSQNPALMEFLYDSGYNNSDTEPDFYSFNAGGYSGEFVYGKDGIVFTKPQKVYIEQFYNELHELYFVITTPDGIKYYFEETETTVFRTFGAGHSIPTDPSITAWYLTKIIHPNGDEIYFSYDQFFNTYVNSESQILSYSNPPNQETCTPDGDNSTIYSNYSKPPTLGPILSHQIVLGQKKLNRIWSNSETSGEVNINYNSGSTQTMPTISSISLSEISSQNSFEELTFNYLATDNDRVFLSSIEFKDPEKEYSFQYVDPELFPERLSKSQDHWGYYNGKQNTNLVPANLPDLIVNNVNYGGANKEPDGNYSQIGMLKKLFYPTKGYTEFEYEPNTYWGERTIYPNQEMEILTAVTGAFDSNAIDEFSILSPSDQTVDVTLSVEYDSQNGDCTQDTGHSRAQFSVKNLATNENVLLYQYDSFGNPINTYEVVLLSDQGLVNFHFDLLEGQEYLVTLKAPFPCTYSNSTIKYYDETIQVFEDNIETGGIRIKATKDISLITNDEIYKRYYYGKFNPLDSESLFKSSGDKGRDPNYVDVSINRKKCTFNIDPIFRDIKDDVITSSSLINLFDTGKSNIYYPYVTISEGGDNFENGGIAKEFILNRDFLGVPFIGDYDNLSAPWTNFGWDNGFEKNVKILKKKPGSEIPIIIQETEKTYTNDSRDDKKAEAFAVRKNFDLIFTHDITHFCTPQEASNENLECHSYCVTDHDHVWGDIPNPLLPIWAWEYGCIAPGADNSGVTCINNPCYLHPNETITYPDMLENLSVTKYDVFSHWWYLDSIKNTVYDINGENPVETTTTYTYDNPDHLQMTKQTTTVSDGESRITEYKYPPDLIGLEQTPSMQDLTDANRIAEPIITETFLQKGTNTEKTSEKHIKYDNSSSTSGLLLPTEVHTKKGLGDIDITNIEDRKITYTKYDANGNLQEYNLENGIPVSIIWGYNKQYPIAKIEGKEYADAGEFVADLQTESDAGTLTMDDFDDLREELSDALITTYLYQPLIGVTEILYPNGSIEYYEYDDFGRLKQVKNGQDEVIKKMEYHYQN